jgi:hypothetical protein
MVDKGYEEIKKLVGFNAEGIWCNPLKYTKQNLKGVGMREKFRTAIADDPWIYPDAKRRVNILGSNTLPTLLYRWSNYQVSLCYEIQICT